MDLHRAVWSVQFGSSDEFNACPEETHVPLGSTSNMGKSYTLKWVKKIAVYSDRCQHVKNSVWVLIMFGFLLEPIEKTCKRAVARAFCPGALAAVQPSKQAPLALTLMVEKQHKRRDIHPSQKNMLSTTWGSCTHTDLWVSLHGLLFLLLRPQLSCKRGGRIHKR